MFKVLLVSLALVAVVACDKDPADGGGSTTTTQPPAVVEPGEKPVGKDDRGLNVGTQKELSSVSTWAVDNWHGQAGPCPDSAAVMDRCEGYEGTVCLKGTQKLRCDTKKGYQHFAWVYERTESADGSGSFKPLEGAGAYIFWFSGCIAGMCDPMSGTALTNQYGYFDLRSSWILDTLRIKKDGYYSGLCANGKPYLWSGQIVSNMPTRVGPFTMEKIETNKCGQLGAKSVTIFGVEKADGIFDQGDKNCILLSDASTFCIPKKK